MTDEHLHSWKPMPMEMGRFVCDCGVTGYRKEYGEMRGQVVPHKQTKKTKGPTTHVGNSNMEGGNARRGKRGPGGW